MNSKLSVIFSTIIILAGCAVSDNPREGGLFGGMSGIHSGTYDARIRQHHNELVQPQHFNQKLREESASLENEARQQASLLAVEQQRMDEMEKNLATLNANLTKLKAKSTQQKNEIAALQRKIENTRQQIKKEQTALNQLDENNGGIADSDRYHLMEKERNRLAKEYKALVEYSKALSDAVR